MPEDLRTWTLITGASDGIGAGFARAYAQKKRNLILVARSRDKLEALRDDLVAAAKIEVKVIVQDLGVPGAAQIVFDQCRDLNVSTLICNAGQAMGGLWSGQPLAKVQLLLQLNVVSQVEMAWLFMDKLEAFAEETPRSQSSEGGLLTVASTAGWQPIPYMAGYSASKAYLLTWTEAIHDEMAERCPNMRITCLCPGPTSSPIWGKNGASKDTVLLGMTTVDQVVNEGIKALERGASSHIPGFLNASAAFANRFAPRFLSRKLACRFMNQSHASERELTADEKKKRGL